MVILESFEIREALTEAVNSGDYTAIRESKYSSMLQISGNLVDAIKSAEPFDQIVMIDRISTELAVKLMQDMVVLAKHLLMSGLKESHLVISAASEEFDNHIRSKSLRDLDSAVADVLNDLKLRENTFAKTPQKILEEAELAAIRGLKQSGTAASSEYAVDPDGDVRN